MGKKIEKSKNGKKRKLRRKDSCSKETEMTENYNSAFFVEEEGDVKQSSTSLQDAFNNFRRLKQAELRASQNEITPKESDPVRMNLLRKKFLMQCKKYRGVPYKKKYHQPGTLEYNSHLFLDCCGLIRRVLRDLHKDFRFKIGPWNQAYMYDTLPLVVNSEAKMRPGDLVFISGEYFNEKSKKQFHNIVHVEVWAGDGVKTIGARWHKGKVQIFDSYKFTSTSYHSMKYHFRSIDTWLEGTCKSFCEKHSWKRTTSFQPSKLSVFFRDQNAPQSKEIKPNGQNEGSDIEDASGDEVLQGQLTNLNNVNNTAVEKKTISNLAANTPEKPKKKIKSTKKIKSHRSRGQTISDHKVAHCDRVGIVKHVAEVETTSETLRCERRSSCSTDAAYDVKVDEDKQTMFENVNPNKNENFRYTKSRLLFNDKIEKVAVNLADLTLECALAEVKIELQKYY